MALRHTQRAPLGPGSGSGAFPSIAITVLHSGPSEGSLLGEGGLAVGAIAALPIGPWVEPARRPHARSPGLHPMAVPSTEQR
jgi:hypothetical protein